MKPQQKSQGPGDWEHQRDEADPQRISGGEYASRSSPRSAPDTYPESHYQYQAQRDHPGVEYFGGSGGYGGGRGEYGQAGSLSSSSPSSQGAARSDRGSYGSHPEQGGAWSRSEADYRGGGYRQQEAFQSPSRQQGYGEDYSRGYGRDENRFDRGQQRENQEYQRHTAEPFEVQGQRRQPPGWSEQGRPAPGYGQAPGYRSFQSGQPQDYHAQEGGVFGGFGSHQDFQQPTGGYGSYGSYEVGSLPTPAERRVPRGPKNYVRSDERIREELCERLAHHPGLDVSEVNVQIQEGRVSLEGTVPQRRMKYEIEEMADHCWGVKDVENRIRVQAAAETRPPMTQMTPTGTSTGPGIALGGSAAPAGQPAGATEARTGGSKE